LDGPTDTGTRHGQSPMLKAALHVHSTYSDGEFTLAELRKIYSNDGCAVVCLTDHAECFDEAKLADYVCECASLSDRNFLFVCGLEYGCERRMHILGYGVTELANTQDPQQVIRHIEKHSGLAVIAHPADATFPWIEGFEVLPMGIETWNSKYDGRYAPRPATFDLLRRLRQRRPEMLAFFGQDLHWKRQFRGLFTQLECDAVQRDVVLGHLRSGRYFGAKGALHLSSSGALSHELVSSFAQLHAKSDRMRMFLKSGKKAIDRLGISVPAFLKSPLRKVF
jgi:hypothetical protein